MYRLARLDRYAPGVGGLVVSVTSKTVAELLVPARGDAGSDRLTELTVGADAGDWVSRLAARPVQYSVQNPPKGNGASN
jgi:hypothetical protein